MTGPTSTPLERLTQYVRRAAHPDDRAQLEQDLAALQPATLERGTIVALLDEHQDLGQTRERYCTCGVPTGDYGYHFNEHLADVLMGWAAL